MTHAVNFELTNLNLGTFLCSERYTISGLSKVHVRNRTKPLFSGATSDWKVFRATSTQPFVVCVISKRVRIISEKQFDQSEIRVYESSPDAAPESPIFSLQEKRRIEQAKASIRETGIEVGSRVVISTLDHPNPDRKPATMRLLNLEADDPSFVADAAPMKRVSFQLRHVLSIEKVTL